MHKRSYVVLLTILFAIAHSNAGTPVQDLCASAIGFEYSGQLRGLLITEKHVMAHERTQTAVVRYAPIPYVLLSAGAGIARLSVDKYDNTEFAGKYGFSPLVGVALFTPRFLEKIITITGSGELSYLSSANAGYRYKGAMLTPAIGAKFSVWKQCDLEGGVKWLFLFGTMKSPSASSDFSNVETVRGYGSVTLHSPSKGAYLALNFDASPSFGTDWSGGPAEASLGISIGMILRGNGTGAECAKDCKKKCAGKTEKSSDDKYFPEYEALKKRQNEMAKDIEQH